MSPSEQPTKNGPSPELVAAQRRVGNLELDIANLRRSMAQHLTATNKLMKAIFALDQEYFGGRFQSANVAGDRSSAKDMTAATQVVEAVAEQLAGESAFADSPMLRDCVGTLVAAVESLRNAAIEVERGGAESVGLPSTADSFPARTFPDNNPLACLNQAAAFCRDVQGVCTRTRDRFLGLKMMLHEAERSRAEAESAVSPVNVEDVSRLMSEEIAARDAEVKSLREQTLHAQEQNTAELRRLKAELRDVQEALERESDLHRSDHAEARSLAAEVERLAAGDPEVAASDDLEITLSVLHEQLEHGVELGSIAGAAEAVMVGWAKLVTGRLESVRRELAEVAAAQNGARGDQALLARVQAELDNTKDKLTDANIRLAEAQARLLTRETEVKRLADERSAEKVQLAREREELSALAKLGSDSELGALRKQLSEVTRSLQTSELAVRNREEALTGRDADFHRLEAEVVRLRETSQTQLSEAKSRSDQVQSELTRVRAENTQLTPALSAAMELQRQLAIDKDALVKSREAAAKARDEAVMARDALQKDRDALRNRLEETRRSTDAASTAARTEIETLRESLATRTVSERQLREELAKAGAVSAAAASKLTQIEGQLLHTLAEKNLAATTLEKTKAEAEQGRRRATDIEAEKSRLATQVRTADDQLRTLQDDLKLAKAQSLDAQRRADHAASELAALKEQLTALATARDKSLAEATALRSAEAQTTAQRDAARTTAATLGAERDRLRSDGERLAAERDELSKTITASHLEATMRQAELSKQLGELRTSLAAASSENQRLAGELAKLQKDKATEPRDTTATWSRRLSDSARDLEDSRRKATEHGRVLDEQKRQLQVLEEQLTAARANEQRLSARVAQLESQPSAGPTPGAARLSALEQELTSEKARAKEIIALLLQSRDAVNRARQSLLDAGLS